MRARRIQSAGLLAALAVLTIEGAACTPSGQVAPPSAVESKVYDLSCEDAFRYAVKTLKVRGHRITAIDRGPSGGTVAGTNGDESIQVRVACGAAGVTVSSSGGHWLEQGIRMSFSSFVDQGDRIWPPPTGPKILVDALPGVEAKLEFPVELEPLGLTALQVRVVNGGTRAIRILPRKFQGGSEGRRAGAISEQGVKEKLAAVDPGIDGKILRPATLRHGEEIRGFVFLPAGSYESVVVMVIDDETGEADEFEIFLKR